MDRKTSNSGLAPPAIPDCNRCRHYYITHDAVFRYGCQALGFKSRRQPGRDVVDASGEPCRYFAAKATRGD